MKFKPGDKVICIDNLRYDFITNLKRGKVYTIKEYFNEEVLLKENYEGTWFENRFVKATKLNKVLYCE